MAFFSWWTVGLSLRQTGLKPFRSYFLWLQEDQRAEEVFRIEIMFVGQFDTMLKQSKGQ